LRPFDQKQSMETAGLVLRFRGTRVAGFDMAADEAGYSIEPHIPAFRFAAEHNIPCTSHAGEARGPESVWETLKELRPRRIGHGVRSIEDPALVTHLQKEGIHLEVCPTCNIQTDVFPGYKDHPIHRLFEMGCSVGVNTDARTMVNITLSQEYQKLHETFGWTQEHFFKCNSNAIRASFTSEDEKRGLLGRLAEEYGEV
jgi:adenosine deaminase